MRRVARTEICESCRFWKASEKGFFGPVVDRSVRGWCSRQIAVTFHSGHCASHSERKPERITLEVSA